MNRTLRRRAGYTLLEILLSLALTVLLLTTLYVAVSVQMNLAKAGRNLVERTTLARALLSRLSTDISAATTLCDPGRYRRDVDDASGAATYSADPTTSTTGTSGASGTSGTTSGTGATGTTGSTKTSGTTSATGTTGTTETAGAGTSASGSQTGGTSTTSSSLTPSTTTSTAATTSLTGPVVLPLGVIGTESTLNLVLTKLPRETWRQPPVSNRTSEVEIGVRQTDGTQLVSDLRVVTYWLAGDAAQPLGLARHEAKIAVTPDALNLQLPEASTHQRFVIAPEVKSVSFEYFDGSTWMSSWDSNQPGQDGLTPQGPPRAIRINLSIDFSETQLGVANDPEKLKLFRHVVAINTANGAPMIELEDPNAGTSPSDGSTTPSSDGSTPSTSSGNSSGATTP